MFIEFGPNRSPHRASFGVRLQKLFELSGLKGSSLAFVFWVQGLARAWWLMSHGCLGKWPDNGLEALLSQAARGSGSETLTLRSFSLRGFGAMFRDSLAIRTVQKPASLRVCQGSLVTLLARCLDVEEKTIRASYVRSYCFEQLVLTALKSSPSKGRFFSTSLEKETSHHQASLKDSFR